MKRRTQALGERNIVGAVVTALRKSRGMTQKQLMIELQRRRIEINASSVSKLEGQTRQVSEIELIALADIFHVSIDDLIPPDKRKNYEETD